MLGVTNVNSMRSEEKDEESERMALLVMFVVVDVTGYLIMGYVQVVL